MALDLHDSIGNEIQKLAPSAVIELFELDARELYDANGNAGIQHYFHAGTNGLTTEVIWKTISYNPFPIEITGFEQTGKGTIPRPTAKIANIDGVISSVLYAYDDLIGAKVIRRRTFRKFLDAANFAGGNADANPDAAFPDEEFYISRKSKENHIFVEFELSPLWDLHGIKLPRRLCIQNVCEWKYKGLECGFGKHPEIVNSTVTFTSTTVNGGIEVNFTWTAHPALLNQGIYVDFGVGYTSANGTYTIIETAANTFKILITGTVTVPASGNAKLTNRFNIADVPIYSGLTNDNCSKKLSSCNLRFGPNSILPYGGFPGVGWVR